jgi:tetratricopeptide (TPR) repeat protein
VVTQPGNVAAWYFLGQSLQHDAQEAEAIAAWRHATAIDPKYTPALWSLARALASTNPAESQSFTKQLNAVIGQAHTLDEARLAANNGIAAMQAHDWPQAIQGLKEALHACGQCEEQASLHKALGLIYCHAGDLTEGKTELQISSSLKPGDMDVQRALTLISRTSQGNEERP